MPGVGADLTGYPGLAVAVIARAVRDARAGNGQREAALAWLACDGAATLLDNLGEALGLDLDGDDLREIVHDLSGGLENEQYVT